MYTSQHTSALFFSSSNEKLLVAHLYNIFNLLNIFNLSNNIFAD